MNTREFTAIFPTLILERRCEGMEALNGRLREIILQHERAGAGVTRSNVGSYHSASDFFKWPEPEVHELFERIATAIKDFIAVERRIEPSSFQLGVIADGWVNIARNGNYARPHVHPNSNLSGVYYVDAGEEVAEHPRSGMLEFLDPRGRPHMFQSEGTDTCDSYAITPKSGMLVIFPSTLYHYAHPYFGERERICVAFNIVIQRMTRAT